MTILSGKRLGPYEILSLLGAGGMGEVYKARDTRLERTVAIKILPEHLADRKDVCDRFDREAKVIASLNHPNICTLYDVGHQDGTDFLVMEYLEGETLCSRLLKGPLPLDQALRYAAEIADALTKAHRQNITHRDLKPGNVMLTKSGAKLLDFGLAKLRQDAAPAAPPISQLRTLSQNPTVEGTILGTPQYMAPEQIEGKIDEIDSRTNIFALGAVIYEMATGRKAFEAASRASLIAKILEHDPPPISSLRPVTPSALDRLVKTCLAKIPDDRCQSAKDVSDQLKWIAEGSAAVAAGKAESTRAAPMPRRWAILSGLACVAFAGVVGLATWTLKPSPRPAEQPLARMVIPLPAGEQLVWQDVISPIALSPDGTRLVYILRRNGIPQLYLRQIDQLDSTPLPGTEGAAGPFFSPDSQWIGFSSVGEHKLKKIFVGGGAPQSISDITDVAEASWGPNDTIIFTYNPSGQGAATALYEVSAAGGKPRAVAAPDPKNGETSYNTPDFLPDGKTILFSVRHANQAPDEAQIVVQSLETGTRRVLMESGMRPRYVPSGHLVYVRAGTLMAAPFDRRQLQLTGPAIPAVTSMMSSSAGIAPYSFSDLGWLVYLPGDEPSKLVWVDRGGAARPLAAPPRDYVFPRISPDSSKIAVQIESAKYDIWIYDVKRDSLSRLTSDGQNTWPIWTPDGKRVAFTSNQGGIPNIFWKPPDDSGPAERLTSGPDSQTARSWSADGRFLILTTEAGISVVSLQDKNEIRRIQAPRGAGWARLSPDGQWLAYVVKEETRSEVYVQPFSGPGGRIQISTEGGAEPVWNPNGRELFYRQSDKMMAVEITTRPTFAAQKPRALFESAQYARASLTPDYDVSADGQRFLMVQRGDQQSTSQLNVILNWFDELKRRAPPAKQ